MSKSETLSVSDDELGCDLSFVAMDSDWQNILTLHGHEDTPGGGRGPDSDLGSGEAGPGLDTGA